MGFYFFMSFMNLLIPLCMMISGYLFMKKPPKNINGLYGYRTNRSMRNEETWQFANQLAGRYWFKWSFFVLIPSLFIDIFLYQKSDLLISKISLIVCMIQLIPLILPIYFVEKQLKKKFD